jgi:glycosyltransferase involved in cell wall biosynthesis
MATFNGGPFLEAQLESLVAQTYAPAELVCCDDRSTDDTVAILERFARDAPFPVRVERNAERLGAADNFVKAAGLCTAAHVAFCDQDDVWLPTKLERSTAALARDVVLAVHRCAVVDERLEPTGDVVPPIERTVVVPPPRSHKWLQTPGMAMTFSRSLLDVLDWEARPQAHEAGRRLLHDEWVYGVARVTGSIAFLAETLVLYRQHGVNVEGAPRLDRRAALVRGASIGWDYYSRRAVQARQWAQLLAGPFPDESASYSGLADLLERRAAAYEPGATRRRRLARIARGAREGVYGRRDDGGFGVRGLARDIVMVAAGRGTR